MPVALNYFRNLNIAQLSILPKGFCLTNNDTLTWFKFKLEWFDKHYLYDWNFPDNIWTKTLWNIHLKQRNFVQTLPKINLTFTNNLPSTGNNMLAVIVQNRISLVFDKFKVKLKISPFQKDLRSPNLDKR